MRPRLIDISRLVSRHGKGPLTGIDRVEAAYCEALLARPEPVFFLVRLPRSYAILDRDGGGNILAKLKSPAQRWSRRRLALQIAASAVTWCRASALGARVRRLFPGGVTYLNVGHANLRREVFAAFDAKHHDKIIVLIHDIIPVSSPEYSRQEVTSRLSADIRRTLRHTDTVVYPSHATRRDVETCFGHSAQAPIAIVAPLGAGNAGVRRAAESAQGPRRFVTIGTIEPRKNHALLLDLWQSLADELPAERMPHLHIIGKRGWNNAELFRRLDSDPMMGRCVFEHGDLGDDETAERLAECAAFLFPSLAEGFGLPLLEAAASGVPILCGENAVYREFLGDYPLYLPVDSFYAWRQEILERANRERESKVQRQARSQTVHLPDWDRHFDRIFRFI